MNAIEAKMICGPVLITVTLKNGETHEFLRDVETGRKRSNFYRKLDKVFKGQIVDRDTNCEKGRRLLNKWD